MKFSDEVIKALPSLAIAIITLLLTWLIGNRLSVRWDTVRKRRDLDLEALNSFYRLYGEFRAIQHLAKIVLSEGVYDGENPKEKRRLPGEHRPTLQALLERATQADGDIEALLMKIASERRLSSDDINVLGSFRQAYQRLRTSIRKGQTLDWWASDHPQYAAFKGLASYVARILLAPHGQGGRRRLRWNPLRLFRPNRSRPTEGEASEAFHQITSNIYEQRWVGLAGYYGLYHQYDDFLDSRKRRPYQLPDGVRRDDDLLKKWS